MIFKRFIFMFIFICSAGCNPFAPSLTEDVDGGSQILTEQRTPEEVLTNFSYAYNFKDSLVYADLLDSSFQFIFIDYSTDPPTNDKWGRDEDIKTTVRMFRHFQNLDLVWGATTAKVYLNEDSSLVDLTKTLQLTLIDEFDDTSLTGWAVFTFIKKKSGIWQILRWEDRSQI